jgi:hypothetical protein
VTALSRSNFSTFTLSLLTIFQLFAGDGWSDVLYASMESKDTMYGQVFAAFFVLSWFIFSKLIAANLFVAVIIENFEVSVTIENIKKPGHFRALRDAFSRSMRGVFRYSVARLDFRNKVNPMTGQKLYEHQRMARKSQVHTLVESTKQERELKMMQMMSRTQMLSNEDSPRREPERRLTHPEPCAPNL